MSSFLQNDEFANVGVVNFSTTEEACFAVDDFSCSEAKSPSPVLATHDTDIQQSLNGLDAWGGSLVDWFDRDGTAGGYTEGWFMTDFRCFLSVIVFYYLMASVGQDIMAKVDPKREMRLTQLRFVYNIAQVMLKSYMFTEAASIAYRNGYWTNYVTSCNVYSVANPVVASLQWVNYMSKIFDLMDTFFMVMEQRERQLNFAHVYHHGFSLLLNWIAVKTYYDGDIFGVILLISFEHVLIYLYFFAAMHSKDPITGGSVRLPWKNQLVCVQLSILALTLVHFGLKMKCPGNRLCMMAFAMVGGQILLMVSLAGNRRFLLRVRLFRQKKDKNKDDETLVKAKMRRHQSCLVSEKEKSQLKNKCFDG